MDVFEAQDYKKVVIERIQEMPKRGYGKLRQLAEFMGVNSTFLSQVFKGPKHLSMEQAILVCDFFGFSDLETRYFLKLVEVNRAGSKRLQDYLEQQLKEIRSQSKQVSSRLKVKHVLKDTEKAIFYSAWYYSGIRLLIGLEGYQDVDAIASHFNLPKKLTSEVIQFLLSCGLLEKREGQIIVGPSRTHLTPDSPFISQHHANWRQRAIENYKFSDSMNLHYTSPMTLGHKEAELVKAELLRVVSKVGEIVDPAPNEELMCLNLDWFRVQPKSE